MAKGKSKQDDRRAKLEALERERKTAERKRTLLFVGVIGVIAAIIIGATGWSLYRDNQRQSEFADKNLDQIGVSADAAACDDVVRAPADGSGDHIESGPITYEAAPPASGPHRPTWLQLEKAEEFYTVEERPEVPLLVHNLEHGYTILWYDQSVADDAAQVEELEGLAGKFGGNDDNPDNAFIAAPWTADDGDAFPEGKHYALTHWYANPETGKDQEGITQYCGKLSGSVVEKFMDDFPQSDAPEGGPRFL